MIDAHVHLWQTQQGRVDGLPVFSLGGGKSQFGEAVRQMLPPYLYDGKNTAEILLANMDYAGVSGCVVTQEEIDGNQDEYLLQVKRTYGQRVKICSLYQEGMPFSTAGFDGIKLCAGRFSQQDLTQHEDVFRAAAEQGVFVSIDLAQGDTQTASLRELVQQYPNLRIAIGHFGMANRPGWLAQIKLARHPNVFIESGGITWLFHKEFYPYRGAVAAIQQAAALCGWQKLMWGSDYPRTMTAITYKMSLDFAANATELTDENKALFLHDNAMEFYRFNTLPVPVPVKNMVEE